MENSNTIQNEYILAINTTLENLAKARLVWLDYHAKNGRLNNSSTEHSRESVLREFFDPQNQFLDDDTYNFIAMLEQVFPVIFMTIRTERNFRVFVDDCEDKLETFGIEFDHNGTFRFVWELLFSGRLKGVKLETMIHVKKVSNGLKAIRDIISNDYFFN